MSDRCHVCDQDSCPVAELRREYDAHPSMDLAYAMLRAEKECQAGAVNWRKRALELDASLRDEEAQLERLRAISQTCSDSGLFIDDLRDIIDAVLGRKT